MSDQSKPVPIEAAGFDLIFARLDDFLANIRNGVADFLFLNFYAPTQSSKTYILQQVWEKNERLMPVSLVHAKLFGAPESCNLSGLLVKILSDLELRLPPRITDLPEGYRSWTDPAQLAELLVQLVGRAKDVAPVLLLLLDDYDLLPEDASRWLERYLFNPLAATRRMGVVLTSGFELSLSDEFDLRMRLERYEIPSLGVDEISLTFPQYRELAGEIYQLTGGIVPLASGLVQVMENANISPANYQEHLTELKRRYFREYVEAEILKEYDSDPKTRRTILVLAPLRRFDIRFLDPLLTRVLPEDYESYQQLAYLDLIKNLGSKVQWRTRGGYELNPALRTVLDEYLRFNDPALFEQVHTAARAIYRELLKEEYRDYYLLEQIYHDLQLQQLKKGQAVRPMRAKVDLEVATYLNGAGAERIREDDVDALRNSLAHDPDLSRYVSEITQNFLERQIRILVYEKRAVNAKPKGEPGREQAEVEPAKQSKE